MSKTNLYLKHKQSGDVITKDSFKNGPITYKHFSREDFTNVEIKVNTYYSFMQAIESNDFYILTDDSFSEEELHMIINIVQHNTCDLKIANDIIKSVQTC